MGSPDQQQRVNAAMRRRVEHAMDAERLLDQGRYDAALVHATLALFFQGEAHKDVWYGELASFGVNPWKDLLADVLRR